MKMYPQYTELYALNPLPLLIRYGRHHRSGNHKLHEKQLKRTEHPSRPIRKHLIGNIQKRPLKRNKRSHKFLAPKPQIDIPGINKIFRSTNRCSRFVWLFVIPVLYSLCVYQLVDRVTFFLKDPTALEIKMKKISSINMPSITICPSYGTYIAVIAFYRELLHKVNITWQTTIDEFNITLESIWNDTKISGEDITISQSCHTKSSGTCDNLTMETHELKTLYGTCSVMTMQNPLPYRGRQTSIDLFVERNEKFIPQKTKELFEFFAEKTIFIPHDRYVSPLHEVVNLGYSRDKGIDVAMRFSLKEVHFLNTTETPCLSQSDEVKCRQRCLEVEIEANISCWLPFLTRNVSLAPCKTFQDMYDALFTVEGIYYSNTGCNCPRSCDETIMVPSIDYFSAVYSNETVFSVNYPDNTIDVVTEYYVYPITSLISDIGGSLGFLVGLCVFSFIEITEYAVENIVDWVKRKYGGSNNRLRSVR